MESPGSVGVAKKYGGGEASAGSKAQAGESSVRRKCLLRGLAVRSGSIGDEVGAPTSLRGFALNLKLGL